MQNVDSTVPISIGEEVVTAGIQLPGGIRSPYPKGLLIGRVVDVARSPSEIVQTVYLEPAAALDRLEYVLVILDYHGGLPPPEEQPTNCQPGEGGTLPDGEQPCIEATPTPSAASSAVP
jgi:cell shape-determining protein MreC